jgi:hypothetical protein
LGHEFDLGGVEVAKAFLLCPSLALVPDMHDALFG